MRWKQRFNSYLRAFELLEIAVERHKKQGLSELEEQGLIQRFEFTHELAWKVMKDCFEFQGNTSITGSRDASREAFQNGLISNGECWMDMIKCRNWSSHTYDEAIALEMVQKIVNDFYPSFSEFKDRMNHLFNQ